MKKNILLLGDSIRMQYQKQVGALLEEKAAVYGPEENCRWSGYLLNSLRFWLPSMPRPDLVQFNCGLWDMGDDYQEGRHFYPPELYEETCVRICRVLRKITDQPDLPLVIATTTPTLHGDHGDILVYNDILRSVARQEHACVNDLYALVSPRKAELLGPDHIHMNEEGVRLLAEKTARCLMDQMEEM